MTLTAEQVAALRRGQPVTVCPPEIGAECVLLRKDVYDLEQRPEYDDSESDPREAYPFVNEVMAEDDANDPWLESYQTP